MYINMLYNFDYILYSYSHSMTKCFLIDSHPRIILLQCMNYNTKIQLTTMMNGTATLITQLSIMR